MKKNKLIPLIVSSLNSVICLILLIFCTPNKLPLLAGIYDEIIVIGSKWWLISGIVLPLIFMVFVLINKNKYIQLIFSELIIFLTYINMLAYSYFITTPNVALGVKSEVPLSVAIFLPIALGCFIYGAMLKNIPYKSIFGVKSKRTTTTEFIWNQSHYYGSYYYQLTGLILFIISLVFTFVRYPLIELIVFVIGLIIPRVVVELTARQMSNKYKDMKAKHEHLTSKNKAKPE